MNSKYFKRISGVISIIGFILGIVLGATCKTDISTSWWTENLVFNVGLMFETWLVSDIIALFFTWMGCVLEKLENIERKFCENADSSSKVMENIIGVVNSTKDKVKNISNIYNSNQSVQTENENTWRCSECGKVNQNFINMCSCGQRKPGGENGRK